MSTATQNVYVKDAWHTPRNARTLRAFMALRNQEIGQRLKELRESHGNPPQQAVAEQVGVSYRSLQAWEAGETKPNYNSLKKVAEYFGTTAEWILVGGDDGPPTRNDASRLARVERKLDLLLDHLAATDEVLAAALQAELEAELSEQDEMSSDSTAAASAGAGRRRR